VPLFRRAQPLLLAAALAVSAHAGVAAPAKPVYAVPSGAWSSPLGVAFTDPEIIPLLPASLASLSLTTPDALRTAAPLIQSLTETLGVTPESLNTMAPAERKTSIELAVEDARRVVREKAYELEETAHQLSRPDRALDEKDRAELYAVVSELMEMRHFYGPWLDDGSMAAISAGYEIATLRAWEVRTALLAGNAEFVPPPATKSIPSADAKPPYVLRPSGSAVKLRKQMENTQNGWGRDDLYDLYTGYGFEMREGNHRMYTHPHFRHLHQVVPLHTDRSPLYVKDALKLIAELERQSAAQTQSTPTPMTGPPAALTLDDLTFLLPPPKKKRVRAKNPILVEDRPVRDPPVFKPPVAEKTLPPRAPPPKILATSPLVPLKPSTERVVVLPRKLPPTPAPVKTNPGRPGLFERIKAAWRLYTTN
jgi:hypothetical protein